MSRRRVWITGAGGLIGSWLVRTAPLDVVTVPLGREQLDLADFQKVEREFKRQQPDLVIHCAALSRSPDCQANPALARLINVDATAHLAGLAANIPFVFFSTDLVFDGKQGNYDELATPHPLSVYAETKVAAESIVLRNPKNTVVRTSLNCGASPSGDRGFDEQLKKDWAAGKTLRLFTDEFRCPINAEVTAQAVWELAAANHPGLFHLAGAEKLSRWQIGRLFAARFPSLNPKLEPASLKGYSGAPRAPDTSLNCSRLQKLLSFPLPGLTEWLARHPALGS